MRPHIEQRSIDVGFYIVNNKSTIRDAAKHFKVGRSTVFRDIHDHLPTLNPTLALSVLQIINQNKEERHIRGGLATKEKYNNS